MISNASHLSQPVVNLLEEIKRSPINFRLTGSRFFVRADSETDKWSPSIYVGDPTIAEVWTNANWPTNPNDRVHIQIIKHQLFHIKEAAQKIIKDRNLLCRGLVHSLSSDVIKKINKFVWMSVQHTLLENENENASSYTRGVVAGSNPSWPIFKKGDYNVL
jgi:hypothetical protein